MEGIWIQVCLKVFWENTLGRAQNLHSSNRIMFKDIRVSLKTYWEWKNIVNIYSEGQQVVKRYLLGICDCLSLFLVSLFSLTSFSLLSLYYTLLQ